MFCKKFARNSYETASGIKENGLLIIENNFFELNSYFNTLLLDFFTFVCHTLMANWEARGLHVYEHVIDKNHININSIKCKRDINWKFIKQFDKDKKIIKNINRSFCTKLNEKNIFENMQIIIDYIEISTLKAIDSNIVIKIDINKKIISHILINLDKLVAQTDINLVEGNLKTIFLRNNELKAILDAIDLLLCHLRTRIITGVDNRKISKKNVRISIKFCDFTLSENYLEEEKYSYLKAKKYSTLTYSRIYALYNRIKLDFYQEVIKKFKENSFESCILYLIGDNDFDQDGNLNYDVLEDIKADHDYNHTHEQLFDYCSFTKEKHDLGSKSMRYFEKSFYRNLIFFNSIAQKNLFFISFVNTEKKNDLDNKLKDEAERIINEIQKYAKESKVQELKRKTEHETFKFQVSEIENKISNDRETISRVEEKCLKTYENLCEYADQKQAKLESENARISQLAQEAEFKEVEKTEKQIFRFENERMQTYELKQKAEYEKLQLKLERLSNKKLKIKLGKLQAEIDKLEAEKEGKTRGEKEQEISSATHNDKTLDIQIDKTQTKSKYYLITKKFNKYDSNKASLFDSDGNLIIEEFLISIAEDKDYNFLSASLVDEKSQSNLDDLDLSSVRSDVVARKINGEYNNYIYKENDNNIKSESTGINCENNATNPCTKSLLPVPQMQYIFSRAFFIQIIYPTIHFGAKLENTPYYTKINDFDIGIVIVQLFPIKLMCNAGVSCQYKFHYTLPIGLYSCIDQFDQKWYIPVYEQHSINSV